MKKKLESDLISIAHRILKLKGKEDIIKMHAEVAELYEKLTVYKFAEENFEEVMPTIGGDSSFFGMLDSAFNNKVGDNIEMNDKVYVSDAEREEITEPLMNTIKDLVAQMPQDTEVAIDTPSIQPELHKNDVHDIAGDYANIPEFIPVEEANSNAKKSLNDRLNTGLQIGLNDKLAFIKHLFNGDNTTYDRVLAQVNTASSLDEAHNLIQNIVKPDYNNWEGKEEYEQRFMDIVERKFG